MLFLPSPHIIGHSKNLIAKGQYHDALTELEGQEKQIDVETEKFLQLKLLQINVLILIGNIEKALEYADKAVSLSLRYHSSPLIFDALILKTECLRNRGRNLGSEAIRHPSKYSEIIPENLPEFETLIRKCETEFNKISETSSPDYLLRKASLYRCKGILLRTECKFEESVQLLSISLDLFAELNIIEGLAGGYSSIALTYGIMGEIEKEIDYLKKSLDCYKNIGIKREVIGILLRLGSLLFHYQSETKLGLDYIYQSYNLSQEIEDESGIAAALGYLGNHCTWLGQLDRGLNFLQRSFILSEKIGYMENLAFTLNNLGWNYHIRGELSLALESLEKSLKISREKQYPWILVWTLTNIGFCLQTQGNFNDACGYYTQSIMVSEEIDDYLALSWGIYQVIKLNLDIKTPQETIKQIERLKMLSSRYKVKLMHQMYRVAHGMLLKNSPRLKDKAQALEYFSQVANEKIESLEITADAMINQCELLLFEYKNSESSDVLADIQNLTNRLLDISEEQNSHSLLSETYMLKAELALLQQEINPAREYITKAQSIAEEKGLKKLALAISREHDKFLGLIGQVEGSEVASVKKSNKLEIGEIKDLLGRMTTRNMVAVTEATPEDPIMLLIIVEGGMTLFTHTFTSNEYVKGQLIGSFLSAIESFSQEVFSSPIERATLGEYRLVIQTQGLLSFSYVFKGESYSAIKRVKKFITILQLNKTLWNDLENKTNTGALLNTDEQDVLLDILDKTFK